MDSIWRPSVEISPNCPRCGSSNTKFCYYNNYSLTQPRYFCKGCRRYWTKGGSLRNVPIGGGCRKSRRGKPWRFPNDGGVSSKGADSLGEYPCATRMSMSSLPESNAATVDGSHIDLAVVYANYLNPQPDNRKPGFEIPELGSEFDTIGSPNLDGRNQAGTGSTIMSGNHDHQQVLYSETENSIAEEYRETENSDAYVLPPLPGEEIFWTSCVSSQTLGTTQEPMFGPDPHDLNLTFANCSWSAFDLSSNDTFSRT